MTLRVFLLIGFLFGAGMMVPPAPAAVGHDSAAADKTAVAAVLDDLHLQASRADGDAYFALFTADAVFIGTDVSERWPIDIFREYALERFATGVGWTYSVTNRHIDFDASGTVAWFDEVLWNDNYGTTRGTGVLVREAGGEGAGVWRIAQYHLTIPIPNDLAAEMARKIRAFEGK